MHAVAVGAVGRGQVRRYGPTLGDAGHSDTLGAHGSFEAPQVGCARLGLDLDRVSAEGKPGQGVRANFADWGQASIHRDRCAAVHRNVESVATGHGPVVDLETVHLHFRGEDFCLGGVAGYDCRPLERAETRCDGRPRCSRAG